MSIGSRRGDSRDPLGVRRGVEEASQDNGTLESKQNFSRWSRRLKRRNQHKPSMGVELVVGG